MRESGRRRAPRRAPAQRAAPYARDAPRSALSIKGASGPTWIIVANLVRGTSLEDVRLTFDPIGRVQEVRGYKMPNLASNAMAFQVAFEQRNDAVAACRKYDGVLADGRVLQVTLQGAEPAARAPEPPAKVVRAEPPKSARSTDASLPIDVRRRLAEAEARYLKETEKILTAKGEPAKAAKAAKPTALKDRLSGLPLAQRLQAEQAKEAKGKNKSKKPRRKTGAMDVDQ